MALKGKNMGYVKKSNRSSILNLLHEEGQMSRKNLAIALSLTPAAVTSIVNDLKKRRLIREIEGGEQIENLGPGRREVLLAIEGKSSYSLGISININEIILAAAYLDGSLVFEKALPPPQGMAAEDTLELVLRELNGLLRDHKINKAKVIGLGVAMRGAVNLETGVVMDSRGVWPEKNFPLKVRLEKEYSFPVTIDNNVRALANAHLFMARDKQLDNMYFIRNEVGIGGALTINFGPIAGSRYQCSEIGKIPVTETFSPSEASWLKLEDISSGGALLRLGREHFSVKETPILYQLCRGDEKKITLTAIVEAARQGDDQMEAALKRAVYYFAAAISTVISLLDPKKIILYGSIFEEEYFLDLVRQQVLALQPEVAEEAQPIEKCPFNLQLEGKCACLLSIRHFFLSGATIGSK